MPFDSVRTAVPKTGVNLVTAAALVVGTSYLIENRGNGNITLHEGGSVAADLSGGHLLETNPPGSFMTVTVETNHPVWAKAWKDNGSVVISEVG